MRDKDSLKTDLTIPKAPNNCSIREVLMSLSFGSKYFHFCSAFYFGQKNFNGFIIETIINYSF